MVKLIPLVICILLLAVSVGAEDRMYLDQKRTEDNFVFAGASILAEGIVSLPAYLCSSSPTLNMTLDLQFIGGLFPTGFPTAQQTSVKEIELPPQTQGLREFRTSHMFNLTYPGEVRYDPLSFPFYSTKAFLNGNYQIEDDSGCLGLPNEVRYGRAFAIDASISVIADTCPTANATTGLLIPPPPDWDGTCPFDGEPEDPPPVNETTTTSTTASKSTTWPSPAGVMLLVAVLLARRRLSD